MAVTGNGCTRRCPAAPPAAPPASAPEVAGPREKLKYWDYKEILQVHELLEAVNESIESLGLVPQGF